MMIEMVTHAGYRPQTMQRFSEQAAGCSSRLVV